MLNHSVTFVSALWPTNVELFRNLPNSFFFFFNIISFLFFCQVIKFSSSVATQRWKTERMAGCKLLTSSLPWRWLSCRSRGQASWCGPVCRAGIETRGGFGCSSYPSCSRGIPPRFSTSVAKKWKVKKKMSVNVVAFYSIT